MFRSHLDQFFQISQRHSTIPREIIAGLTIFGSMAYIMAVNPAILAGAGLARHDMVMTTIAGAVAGTLLMALWARLPLALAPAMSSNVLFTQVIVQQAHVSPPTAFTVVLFSGLCFTLLSLTRLRLKIIQSFPPSIVLGIQVAIGAFIARIGLVTAGIAVPSSNGLSFAPLSHPSVILALAGILLCLLLQLLRVPAGLLITIIILTLLGLVVPGTDGHPLTQLPARLIDWPHYPVHMLAPFSFGDFFHHIGLLLPITLYMLLSDFFDATATMLTVTRRAGLHGTKEHPELDPRAFTADGAASILGALLGTCTVSAYLESLTGAETGGRTGLSALTVALLFAVSCCLWPLITAIPALATAPILVFVGIIMLGSLTDLPRTMDDAFPPLCMLLLTVVTGNFMLALACGMLLYTTILIVRRAFHKITPIIIGLDITFLCYMILQGQL
ncbi:NCS2 family permease [Bombella sp. TMW 2.2543]|uniref:NCS2 family permease n=1 Tax=Bombella pluederhausensis TaxID=2967336 RepID=A0ABT3WI64_9PROT|nr:NCS2 family permease [Bombella pluederhausensis]MCX5618772.1 NCS2 family permease [Bombella pluederhausensis]